MKTAKTSGAESANQVWRVRFRDVSGRMITVFFCCDSEGHVVHTPPMPSLWSGQSFLDVCCIFLTVGRDVSIQSMNSDPFESNDKEEDTMINLGDEVVCVVTGFKGIAIGRAQYLSGCARVAVQQRTVDGKIPEAVWFDEPTLIVAKAGAVKVGETAQKAVRAPRSVK